MYIRRGIMNNKEKQLSLLAEKMTALGFVLKNIREIAYGLQGEFMKGNEKAIVRVYESKKKGLTTDLSQIKNEDIKKALTNITLKKLDDGKMTNGVVKNASRFLPPLIGTDEAGKGDYFGPLCIAGVYVDSKQAEILLTLGIKDSKKIQDKQILKLADEIRTVCPHNSVVVIKPAKYNEMYERMQNINRILGWGHAACAKNILKEQSCPLFLADKFGNPVWIEQNMKGINIDIVQEPKGEANIAVAAASVLAREAFLKGMKHLNHQYSFDFPLGASEIVVAKAKQFVIQQGSGELIHTAKVHFATTKEVLQ